jgi:hypothetical protein
MSEPMLVSLTPEALHPLMQQFGYRTELLTDRPNAPYLRSATGGMPFEVQFLNRATGDSGVYIDMSFVMSLRIQGEVPLEIVNQWNNSKRFARLRLLQNVLLLDMDVIGLGGTTEASFRASVSIWDQLVQELLPFLRTAMAQQAPATGTAG